MAGKTEVTIQLPKLNIQTIVLPLVGDTPLICHAWSEKAKKMIRDKQTGAAAAGKEHKKPEQDFVDSLYPLGSRQILLDEAMIAEGKTTGLHIIGDRLHGGEWGFPVIGFKAAAVTACTATGAITKVMARQAFHVHGDVTSDYEGKTKFSAEFVKVQGADPRMREDMCRVGMGVADIRYRGEFFPWFVELTVRFNANVMSIEQIGNLFNHAGFGVGVGEWRAERDGASGLFHVGSNDEVDDIRRVTVAERKRVA